MKAIMVMFDSLNRHMLPPYGCDWVHAPNFERLARRAVTFDKAFVGSMPCMPARRELHTGRYNFLHRSWGPIEPFDDSMPEILKTHDIYTHLVSDHYHYWEEGGCTYHTRFHSWEISRGQEGEGWKGYLPDPPIPKTNAALIAKAEHPRRSGARRDWVNRYFTRDEKDMPQAKTFAMGLDFMADNHKEDNWFLQIETFDPHEPYFVPEKYKQLYDFDYTKFDNDWPRYEPAPEDKRDLSEHYRYVNAALISMCDTYLGKFLDAMDRYDLWKDTMVIVNTDHGFLLGEHDWWGKCRMPFYNEVAQMPLFIWDPRCGKTNERRQSLVQTIDLPATLLDFFGLTPPDDMMGIPLRETIAADKPVRTAGLFGIHGGHVNCTDGKYVYMRAPATAENAPLYNYTQMPTHMRHTFSVAEMRTMAIQPPFSFTKDSPTMKIDTKTEKVAANATVSAHGFGNLLFDIDADPREMHPIQDEAVERKMKAQLVRLMKEHDAPVEQYERLGLVRDA